MKRYFHLMAVLFVSCGFAFGQDNSFSYTDFSDVSDLTFVRSAGTRDNKLDLNGNGGNTVGAVWTKDKYPVADGFRTSYTFQIGAQTGGGSDGIWFYVQNRAADAVSASGYANSPAGGTQLDNNYFYVGIDTYRNPGWDPNNWHLEWGYAGLGTAKSNLNSTPLPDTKNSNIHTITIDYNATAKRFTAFYDDTLIIEADLDLENITSLDNGTAYLGWQGVCGGPAESHEILSWNFNQETEDPLAQDLNKGLVAYYPFNGNANDESGNGINGTVNGPTLTSDRFELPDSAYRFDSPSHIILPDVESIKQLGANYSFSFWVFTDNLTQNAYLISKDGWAVGRDQWLILLGYTDGKITFHPDGNEAMASSLLESNSWQHITITHEGSFLRLYRDGILDTEIEGNRPLARGEGRGVRFGGPRGTSQSHFTGLLDDIRIYDRGLGKDEVASLYALESGEMGPEPETPFVAINPLYESPTGESITLDATPTVGFPTEFTYQWCFNGFKIPANLGGTASSINIDNLQANEGTWSVTVTNSEGIFEQDFEYRLYVDSDTDGLSDGYEEIISKTEINNPDTDNDGLVDGDEVNVYSTNPNSPDTDSDGFTDLYEVETAYDPNSAESVPDALVNIMTAIEVKFNAALGATYAIEFSTDNQNWDIIEDDIVGEGGAVERLYSKQNFPTGFFRVERRDQ